MLSKETEKLITSYPEEIKNICLEVRKIIISVSPLIEESIKYKIPFYSYKGMLCYLNPKKKGFVNFGFSKGYMIHDFGNILKRCGKEVSLIQINNLADIKKDLFVLIIQEAMLINEKIDEMKNG